MFVDRSVRTVAGRYPALFFLACTVLAVDCSAPADSMLGSAQVRFSTELTLLDGSGQPATVFAPGEPVTLELKVTNLSPDSQTVTLPSSRVIDFVVASADGVEQWHWSWHSNFLQVVTPLEFAAGEAREFTLDWAQVTDGGKPLAPGGYRAEGFVPVKEPGLGSTAVSFEIR
jgi:hypothetical protein